MSERPSITMPIDELAQRYASLPAFPVAPGDRCWFDRLRTLDDFIEDAPIFVDWQTRPSTDADDRRIAFVSFPALYRLAFAACGVPVPPDATSAEPDDDDPA